MRDGEVESLANDVDKLWDLWNLRVCLIISLSLQFFLLFAGSMRKRCKSNFLHLWIWSAYLLADWIAAYALGQTVQRPGTDLLDPKKCGDLSIFWAQFLLLHLAGSDSITSFSPGDNGVWLRPLFGLLCQVVATIYSFSLLVLAKRNKLWIPTILVFVVGLTKSYERVKALVDAGFDRFGETLLPEPNPGPDYEDAVFMYRVTRGVQIEMEPEKKIAPITYKHDHQQQKQVQGYTDFDLLSVARSFFEYFKVIFTGSFLSFQNRETSRKYFLQCSYREAFRVIEYELSLLHDLMHTKMSVLQNRLGYIRRVVCLSSVLVASILFFIAEKQGYTKFDVNLTHALLFGTICLDIVSLIKVIFSQWSDTITSPWIRPLIPLFILERKRWSKAVFQYNMFNYCLSQRRLFHFVGHVFNSTRFMEKMRAMWYSSLEKVTNDLEEFIFMKLHVKSSNANDLKAAKEECSQRGISALLHDSCSYTKLEWSIREFQYLESLLLWHLATELCCHNTSLYQKGNYAKFCKILSNYMFYLLVVQPTMLSQEMGNFAIVLQDTQAEAIRFFTKHSISSHKKACEKLNSIQTPYRPAAVKGSQSKSLLFDACILAKELQSLDQKLQWEVMSRVWLELMSFAAINCSPTIHAQQPSRGGELLTFTWLLMNHLGLGTQFSEQLSHG
ncbi:uncharacterized protein LOC133817465 [Humulus lupulus]|uniref:uncharacterized protein LOC133817465 n=1 Tax=Humulus lupulus TaxID=3486 RepID=UPI002B407182|nr:uncharacterized protein LOC133817465 [Humulus lupulus]XP_062105977.1 uncharacterized protein LOC133817465 [Humulus lupulus]